MKSVFLLLIVESEMGLEKCVTECFAVPPLYL